MADNHSPESGRVKTSGTPQHRLRIRYESRLLLIALAGTAFGAMRTGTLIRQNLTMIGSQIGRVVGGNYDNKVNYTLPGFADQDSKLKQLLNHAPVKADEQ